MEINYQQICSNILRNLPQRQKEVVLRRFGLAPTGSKERETLEAIGKDFGITRERVRQIEKDAFLRLKPEIKKYQKVFNCFRDYLRKRGGLAKEERILQDLGGEKFQNQVYFLLNLEGSFFRIGETDDFHALWTNDQETWSLAQKTIKSIYEKLQKTGKPLKLKELVAPNPINSKAIASYLEVSKKIQGNQEGLWGLKDWPEINPKRIRDKAYLVFKKEQKPLHFNQVASLIDSALPQTVHNELIKDPRFVLVGRGIYALKEWGYEEGMVKDIIAKILKSAGRPLKKEEILAKTLEQRLVKENTVFLNLSNKKYFLRNSEGFYTIREA